MFDTGLHTSNELNSSSKEVRNLRVQIHCCFYFPYVPRSLPNMVLPPYKKKKIVWTTYKKSCIVEASYNFFIQNVWGPFYPIFPLRSGPLFCIDVEHACVSCSRKFHLNQWGKEVPNREIYCLICCRKCSVALKEIVFFLSRILYLGI